MKFKPILKKISGDNRELVFCTVNVDVQ
jgi:thioredoxin-like negative regulator of GroEL